MESTEEKIERLSGVATSDIYEALAREMQYGDSQTVARILDEFPELDINHVFKTRTNIPASNDWAVTLLSLAVHLDNYNITLLLLDRGADINAVGGTFGTALAAAACLGQREDTLLLLLDRGADANVVGGPYGTPLAAATFGSWFGEQSVSVLLERGADINAVEGPYGTALAAAAFASWYGTHIVLLLLERGADINAVGGTYGTALGAAAYGGKNDTVLLLLDRGADINAVGGTYGTALAVAAYKGKKDTVLLLLDQGADVNTVGGTYGTALAAAAYEGEEDTVLLLLDRGADIGAVGGTYGTALAAAAYKGKNDTVLLLLDRGADINAAGGTYGTALAAAAYKGEKDTVLLLLDRGADINAVGGTAFAAACSQSQVELVSLFLARGVDLHAVKDIHGATLLIAAAMASKAFGGMYTRTDDFTDTRCHDQLLLELDALDESGNAVRGEYGSALGLAVHFGDTETVSLLLKRGTDTTRVGGAYRTHLGVYPNALDAAIAKRSAASPALREMLVKATGQHTDSTHNYSDEVLITRSPFPMPYNGPASSYQTDPGRSKATAAAILSSIRIPCDAGHTITPDQADVFCREVNEENLIRLLVGLVGLHAATAERLRGWIQGDVQYFIARNFDFGLAYAAARVAWKNFDEDGVDDDSISAQRGRWHWHAKQLDSTRSEAIYTSEGSDLIKSPYSIMPRRIWDLKSNRVVEWRMLHAATLSMQKQPDAAASTTRPAYWAVSHSWTDDMNPIKTSVNQYQWGVPLPRNLDLGSQLRPELVSLGAEYIWVDVLCLRQRQTEVHADLDRLKEEEWKIDVPTIGNIYRAADRIVRYFNGLGIQFSQDGWDDTHHWLRRAWTLQEIRTEHTTINAGVTHHNSRFFMNTLGMVAGKQTTLRRAIRPVLRLSEAVDSPRGCDVYELAREMAKRHSSQPVDKLLGLFYLLRTTELPCYNDKMTSEYFWSNSFNLLPLQRKAEILFDFPHRGSDQQWFPTWEQMMSWPERDTDYDHVPIEYPNLDVVKQESCWVHKIWSVSSVVLYPTNDSREYELKVRDKFFGFYSPYVSQNCITNFAKKFTLVVPHLKNASNWVVCEALGETTITQGKDNFTVAWLKKVAVLRTDSLSELLVGGDNGGSLLKQIDCLIV